MIKRIALLTWVLLLIVMVIPLPVYAIADPDSSPAINAVYMYEDLLADGDAGALIDYTIDYTVLPDETATEAFLFIFIDTDGVTQLKSVAPFSYNDKGYGRGLAWIHFTPAEVTAYGIDSANELLYEIWLVGNPTLSWSGDPPKTIAGLDYWQPSGSSASTLLALRVLSYATILEVAWGESPGTLIEDTPLGSRLTTTGEAYFPNVIADLRTIAPSVFSAGEYDPTLEDIDYTTSFGATMTNGTGTVTGSPITLAEGDNTVTVTVTGTFTLELNKGTVGTVTDDTGTVTGSPVDLVYGTNTITVTGAGDLTVTVNLEDTQSQLTDNVTGTGLDLTDAATAFGMSRWMFSGLIWLIMTVVICAATYVGAERSSIPYGNGNTILLVFDVCIIGGIVLGLMHPLVGALIFIAFGALTGYVMFFKSANV